MNETVTHPTSQKLRVAAYCRVSTEQEEQTESFENQVMTYRKRIEANPQWEFAGIYADKGISGTEIMHRKGFQNMICDCQNGKIDLILTKSISRFARNVIDSLKYTRDLKAFGVSVEFEEEHLNSMDPGAEMIFTILSAVAEQESRNISEHTKWGMRAGYQRGHYKNTTISLLGYQQGENGKAEINNNEAKTVRMIFKNFLEGMTYGEIAHTLNTIGVPGKNGSKVWHASMIYSLLENEKYKGDVRLQKTYVKDFMTHKTVKNQGELKQYYLPNEHPAIIDADTWEAVQLEILRRKNIVDADGKRITSTKTNPYSGKIFLEASCGALFHKRSYATKNDPTALGGTWKCNWYKNEYSRVCHNSSITSKTGSDTLPACPGFSVNDRIIKLFFLRAWNSLIDGNLRETRLQWEASAENNSLDPLHRIRARQMLELTAPGSAARITGEIPELTKMVLEKIVLKTPVSADVFFLNGTMVHVDLDKES